MADLNWDGIDGINEADDSDAGICARLNKQGNTEVAFLACGSVIVFELTGNLEFLGQSAVEDLRRVHASSISGDGVYVAASIKGKDVLIGLDYDCATVELSDPSLRYEVLCESSMEYTAEDFDALSEYYDNLLDTMGLAEE